jgi:cell division protein FtsW
MDGILLTFVLLLCLSGVVMVYSSSAILARSENLPETAYLWSQSEKLVVGLLLLWFCSRMPYRFLYGRVAWWALGVSGLLLVALVLPLGLATVVRGTRRFLDLGVVQLQPAEFARLGLVVFLAHYASRKAEWIQLSWRSLIVPLAAIGGLAGLTMMQPNLSSALLMGMLGLGLLFLAGHPVRRLLPVVAPFALAAPFVVKGYQIERLLSFFRVVRNGHDVLPYQVKQSLIALGSGGFLGKGIGRGLQKFHYLPFPHSDCILGIVGEETGFLGVLVLFTFYGIVMLRGLRIARLAPDRFSGLLALGLTMSVALNFFLHSVVVLGLGPVTGVPLPFVSHGGSSLLVNLMAVGILLSISRHIRLEPETIPRAWNLAGSPSRAQ